MSKRLSIIGIIVLYSIFSPQTTGIAKPEKHIQSIQKKVTIDDRFERLTNSIELIEIQQKMMRLQNQIYDE